jgi:hypothetical protein
MNTRNRARARTHTTTAAHPETPWEWALPAGCAHRVQASPLPRWLQVTGGVVWLTATADAGVANPDRWLAAGERLWLPAGSEWIAEGDQPAHYTLLEAPVLVAAPVSPLRGARRALAAWALRWSFLPAPSVCV